MTATNTRKDAREHLQGKWGKGALIVLAYVVFTALINLVESIIGGITPALEKIISIVITVIEVPISYGFLISFIKLKRGEEIGSFDFVKNGFNGFSRAWGVCFRMFLKMILPVILVIVSIVIISASTLTMAGGFLKQATQDTTKSLNSSYSYNFDTSLINEASQSTENSGKAMSGILIGFVLLLASEIYLVMVSLKYVLSYLVAYDNPEFTGLQAVEESARLMNKNRGNYFVLMLSFIGWAILSVVTLGIGYFFLIPYIMVSTVSFYDELKQQNTAN